MPEIEPVARPRRAHRTRERILLHARLAHGGELPGWIREDEDGYVEHVLGVLAERPSMGDARRRRIAALLRPSGVA